MVRRVLVLYQVLVLAALAAAELPDMPTVQVECHGLMRHRPAEPLQRFWLRVEPEEKVLRLLYTPPEPAQLGGTHLADAPLIRLDRQGRVLSWDDRAGLGEIQWRDGAYQVRRDRTPTPEAEMVSQERVVRAGPAWDRTLAPLLVAITWSAGSRAQVPCLDLHGDRPAAAVAWNGPRVALAGIECRVESDPQGRLKRLIDGQGVVLVQIDGWATTEGP